MSTHYLIDAFTSPVASAPIIDVDAPENNQTLLNGAFVVRVPANTALIDPSSGNPSTPTNCGDLLTKKHTGILQFYAGFQNIVYDDLLDSSGINLSGPNAFGSFGGRGTIALNPGGTLTSNMVTLVSTPAIVVLLWEVFTFSDSDPETGRYTRNYSELPTTSAYATAQVSTNNGGAYTAATNGAATGIALANQGNQFIVQITNTSGAKLGIGSWALCY